MAEFSAAQVMSLRKKTDAPMMECKQALAESGGDETKAIEWLKAKHKGKMELRSDRETGEGWIGLYIDPSGSVGALAELRCESAPVAKNELFQSLANKAAENVAKGSVANPAGGDVQKSMEAEFTEVYGKLRETMNLGTCCRVSGDSVIAYVHFTGKQGVIMSLQGKLSKEEVGRDLAMHAVSLRPVAVDRKGVPADQVEKVRTDAIEQAKSEGKPDHIIEKIAEGKVNAFFSECVLLEQEHVRSDVYGKKKIKDVLSEHGVSGVSDMVYVTVSAG